MSAKGDIKQNLTREERLAAKLRENLRRRKVQARAMGEAGDAADGGSLDGPGEGESAQSLPKAPPSR